jgi:8-oxo-dGTP pyrophosphatase MutT (NUDIX family)
MSQKKLYCSNCSKYGHHHKKCPEPKISVGIVCIDMKEKPPIDFMNNIENINVHNFNYSHLSNLEKINNYKNKIRFLLVCRKHSLNYIHFIRGLYDENNFEKIKNIFSLMSKKEITQIYENNFDILWKNVWNKTADKKSYQKEYILSKKKFNILKENGSIEKLYSISSDYISPEWEIPKGRKNNNETNIDCGMREFYEETGINNNSYDILYNLYSVQDDFIGTNGVNYKHVFYIGINKNNDINYYNNNFDLNNIKSKNEVSNLKWCTWEECIKLIRPYHQSKINIINELFILMINMNEEYNYNIYNNINI